MTGKFYVFEMKDGIMKQLTTNSYNAISEARGFVSIAKGMIIYKDSEFKILRVEESL